MENSFTQLLPTIIFLTTIFFHMAKRNFYIAIGYALQSLAVVFILFNLFLESYSLSLLTIIILMLVAKVIAAPIYFIKLIKKHGFKFTVTTYLSLPLTIIAIAIITAIAYTLISTPLSTIYPNKSDALSLSIAAMLISLFLMINRKGALSQTIGILSLENGIVTFAALSGLEQSAAFQIGILFNIVIWYTIAVTFISMIYEHFGSLNITTMKELTD